MHSEAFEQLVVSHYDTLLRIAVQHTGIRAEAEDIVQETFLHLLETDRCFESDAHAKAFLIRACINRCTDYLRSARRRRQIQLTDAQIDPALTVPPPDADSLTSEVLAAMQQIRPAYRNVVYLYYYEDYSIREIAQILGKSVNTVSSWLTRARKQLKEVLQDETDELSEGAAVHLPDRGGKDHESTQNHGAARRAKTAEDST